MRIAIMQPYFFPYLGYFQLIQAADVMLLYGQVSFRKKSYITRNQIYDRSQNAPSPIRVPVLNASSHARIDQTQIEPPPQWRGPLLRKLANAYGRAKCFDETYPVLEKAIPSAAESVHELNCNLLKTLASHLGLGSKVLCSDSSFDAFEAELEDIGRNEYPGVEIKSVRIIELCRRYGASEYLNPIGGQSLYSKETFQNRSLGLRFHNMGPVKYPQFGDSFTPFLSIIDTLMHVGKANTQELLQSYELL